MLIKIRTPHREETARRGACSPPGRFFSVRGGQDAQRPGPPKTRDAQHPECGGGADYFNKEAFMAGERKTARELIDSGLRETERCISQKQYNAAMIKARQTLEYIVKSLCRRNGVQEGDLSVMIDDLYLQGLISKDSCANYQKIRLLGENAVSKADNNAYNANNAYQLLSQEVYAYQSRAARREHRPAQQARRSSGGQKRPASQRSGSGYEFNPFDLLKIVIPILAIILIISIFRLVRADHPKETTAAAEVTTEAPAETTTAAPETEATEPAPVLVYTTKTSLNVRSAPSTDAELLTTLPAGTVLDYVGAYNDSWSIINYNGGQAYVSTKYVDVQEQAP